MPAKKAKPVTFSPYFAACDLGAVAFIGGINWSYAVFEKEAVVPIFISRCREHGYRTRNEHITDGGNFAVQYHHFEN